MLYSRKSLQVIERWSNQLSRARNNYHIMDSSNRSAAKPGVSVAPLSSIRAKAKHTTFSRKVNGAGKQMAETAGEAKKRALTQQFLASQATIGLTLPDLEDLLLQSHRGLVLLRDLPSRRARQWKEVADRCDALPPALAVDNPTALDAQSEPQQTEASVPSRWLRALLPQLLTFQQQLAVTAHCALHRLPRTVDLDRGRTPTREESIAQQSALVKQRAHALAAHHRLQHALSTSQSPPDATEAACEEDVNALLQFTHMQHQQAVVLERFCLRLKWLPTSHRFHLRQRMLALVHQQDVKNNPQSGTESHLHCPLFILTPQHFAAELKSLTCKYSLSVSDGDGDAGDSQSLRKSVDELLASMLESPVIDQAGSTTDGLEMELESLLPSHTGSSRWELLQRGYLGDYQSDADTDRVGERNDFDLMLANEWELLRLNDLGYLRARLEALANAHMDRAKVDVASSKPMSIENSLVRVPRPQSGMAIRSGKSSRLHENEDDDDEGCHGPVETWGPEMLYSLYALRVHACRSRRRSLLRLLNYFHFVQLTCRSRDGGAASRRRTRGLPRESGVPTPFDLDGLNRDVVRPLTVKRCEKTGEYIVLGRPSELEDGEHEDSAVTRDREWISAAARCDLAVLEQQMLRIASVFIRKQECESLPSASKPHNGSDPAAVTVVVTIDRMQVLRDVYDCEVAFQEAKLQLVETLLATGLQYAPSSHDHVDLGLSVMSEDQADAFASILLPLLQRRPLIDFSHAYFFESYAAETIQLELQTSLIRQIQKHFDRLEWCPYQQLKSSSENDLGDGQQQWTCRQILGAQALARLYTQQDELLREADEKWFSPTSVGAYHALQHALLEQTLVTWSLLVKVELPDTPVQCLEVNADDILSGSGWLFALLPQLVSDVCRTLHDESSATTATKSPCGLVQWLARALELQEWRRDLANSVYEANLLERIHRFQCDFVKHAASPDVGAGAEQRRQLYFFFDFASCDRTKALQPLAMELEAPKRLPTLATSVLSHSALITESNDSRKTVSKWLESQLHRPVDEPDEANDDFKPSESWRRSMLLLQQRYASFLEATARYQDAIGSDVFEFAASYPYVCVSAPLPSTGDENPRKASVAMDISTVRTKYAPDIAEKMADEMRTQCFPYWTALDALKSQLKERFTTSSEPSDDLKVAFRSSPLVLDAAACSQYLETKGALPSQLIALNGHLKRLRNEKLLMQKLSASTRATCAFTSHSTAAPDSARSLSIELKDQEEGQPSGLITWLLVKLHQLKVDLQIHERPKVEPLLLTPASTYSPSSSTSYHRAKLGSDASERGRSDGHGLLQTLPSFRYLLWTFATTHEWPRRDSATAGVSGGAASAHAARLREQRRATLRALLSIFQELSYAVELLRIRCGSRFTGLPLTQIGGQWHQQTSMSAREALGDEVQAGFGRLERWQVRFHREIRRFLDQIADKFSAGAVMTASDLFATHPEQLQSQQHATLMRQEISDALQEANAYLVTSLRCATSFAVLQTFRQDADAELRRRRHHLLTFRSRLVTTAAITPPKAIRALVAAAERVFFGGVRPCDNEREWHAFSDALGKYEQQDSAYIIALTRVLELHRVFIEENCRLRLRSEKAAQFTETDVEKRALGALEELWQRFQLSTWDSGSSGAAIGRSAGPGTRASPFSASKGISYALRSLRMGGTASIVQLSGTGVLILPPTSDVEEQLAFLRVSVELSWTNADLSELNGQYESFLLRRKTHREQVSASKIAVNKPSGTSQALATPTASPTFASTLLALSKYVHEAGSHGDSTPVADADGNDALSVTNAEEQLVFVVPALEMAQFLQTAASECVDHNKQQSELHEASMQQLHAHCRALARDRQTLERQLTQSKLEERIRREAFAVDHAYKLYFEVEALRKQLVVVQVRKDLDQQELRCELGAEYDEKLRVMHVELLSKQHKFAEYRSVMQHELQLVIQSAHSQFVDQLLDSPGSLLPLATKTAVSNSLRGQQTVEQLKSENVALKQVLLKLQACGDMQQQTQTASRERELLLTQRHATAEALQRSQVEQLQLYTKQLEADLSQMSQEKTAFQVKWTSAKKQMEADAARRREAKVRALSASHVRSAADAGGPGGKIVAASARTSAPVPLEHAEESESDFEAAYERLLRPRTAASGTGSSADDSSQALRRLETQHQNATRHYQNELRRLQTQLARESREKIAIAQQLTQLRSQDSRPSDQLPLVEQRPPPEPEPAGRKHHLQAPSSPRRAQSASARTPSRPSSVTADRMGTPRRFTTSFSPRASLLRAQVTAGPGHQPPVLSPCSNPSAASSRPGTASGAATPPTRKYQVVQRDTNALVGGITGAPNAFSVREPLPYR
ncbi:hypothetical protein BBJ28_00009636 [Nothophytophthora sp. Chile5]|nr:hypothetical protein BBJ28_00009636 [Nothophytophthora sp. Chile5]